ncbi:cysteine hydrolase [Xanthomonas campestris pv. badrii]|uniref:Cysteine hydrolase n=1 Tax=Xanthomonas campestris pv. badrii TaxID=149696 RepID=A0A7Z2ZIX9_XANCA|nr:isochorismatase family cysteine hydrolase [Xanthomonas campestris]MCC4603974.1 cysteine hydrolase [Xanthomonas campestris pv. parthenii]QJD69030.1 cysteine hydrolase [Xanthomonas campestris pv. badrii]
MTTTSSHASTPKSALILIEYVNDWLAPTGGIHGQFQDREQVDLAIANSKTMLAEARRRGMDVIHASLKFEPSFKVLGEGKYGLRKMMRDYGSFLGEQADFFPGFEPQDGEYVIRERAGGSSVFVSTTLDSYLRNNRIFDIYLAGFALRQCVESSMRNAHDLGYNTNVIYDASAAFTRDQQTAFLNEIAPFYANAITTQDFVKQA